MANHPSALKRHRQSEKKRLRNQSARSKLKTLVKKVKAATKKDDAAKILPTVVSAFHKAAQKGVMHRKTASRHVSHLSQFVNGLS